MEDQDKNTFNEFDISAMQLAGLIQKTQIFSSLTEDDCNHLIKLTSTLQLNEGVELFHQGDASDNMYLLLKGELIATINNGRKVGIIRSGEIVGELGVFSRRQRTLTISATQPSVLLVISREALITFFESYVSTEMHMKMIDSIILRAQSAIKLLGNDKLFKHIAILPATDEPINLSFINQLRETATRHNELMIVDNLYLTQHNLIATSENIKKIINQADINDKIIAFIIDTSPKVSHYINIVKFPEAKTILENIDGLFIVADAYSDPSLSQNIRQIIDNQILPFISRKELVLLHPSTTQVPFKNTKEWLDLTNFNLHHHIRMENSSDFQRLARFFIGKPNGLVLSGGGIKIIASIGAIKAFEEAKIPIDAVGGTSAGAGLAAAYALNQDYDQTFQLMQHIFKAGFECFSLRNLSYPIVSITSGRELTESLQSAFGDLNAEELWLPNFSIACNLSTCTELVQTHGNLSNNLRCSASLPLIYPPVVINGELIVDGALLNNLPVDRMRGLIGKKSYVLAVNLSDTRKKPPHYNFPNIVPFSTSLLARTKLAHRDFKYPPLVETFFNALMAGSSLKNIDNAKDSDLLIELDLAAYPLLNLPPEMVDELIQIGYLATKAAITNATETQLN